MLILAHVGTGWRRLCKPVSPKGLGVLGPETNPGLDPGCRSCLGVLASVDGKTLYIYIYISYLDRV